MRDIVVRGGGDVTRRKIRGYCRRLEVQGDLVVVRTTAAATAAAAAALSCLFCCLSRHAQVEKRRSYRVVEESRSDGGERDCVYRSNREETGGVLCTNAHRCTVKDKSKRSVKGRGRGGKKVQNDGDERKRQEGDRIGEKTERREERRV